jgi:peptide/nickel transport system substrate-binding protein
VTVALSEKFTTLDTLTSKASGASDDRVRNLLFNTLTRKNEKFEYVGELAKDIQTSPDHMTITFTLRDGVKFHNGNELTASDVKYTFDELFKSESNKAAAMFDSVPLSKDEVSKTPPSANTAATETKTKKVAQVTSVEVVDAKTVVFKVTRPALRNQLLAHLVAIPIIPEGTAATQKDSPIGSGPFRFVSYDASQNVIDLEANTEYWEGAPKVSKLRVKTVTDATALQAELQTGGVDIAPNPSNLQPDSLKALTTNPNLTVQQFEGSNIRYLVFNCESPPLDNAKIRQAIGYAVDRQKIITDLLANQAKIAHSVIPDLSWAYSPGQQYSYDPAKAKQLLQEAGYKKEPIVFKYDSASAMVNQYAQVIQSSLTEIGLEVQIETLEANVIRQQLAQGQFQMFTGQFVGGNQDPIFLRDLFSSTKIPTPTLAGFNRSRYKNEEVDKTVEDAVNATDNALARQLYGKTWDIVSNELPLLPLWYPANIVVANKRIGNIKITGSGDWSFLKDITAH